MNFQFVHHPATNQKDESGKHMVVLFNEPPHNTSEGSEFLNDAIRMKDQPLIYTEESVATASPDNLL